MREFYGCTGTPNTGVKMEPAQVAQKVRQIEASDPNLKNRRIIHVGDPAIWGSQTGMSVGDLFERERVFWEKGEHNRMDGKMQVHHRLAFDDRGVPMLYVFANAALCVHEISHQAPRQQTAAARDLRPAVHRGQRIRPVSILSNLLTGGIQLWQAFTEAQTRIGSTSCTA